MLWSSTITNSHRQRRRRGRSSSTSSEAPRRTPPPPGLYVSSAPSAPRCRRCLRCTRSSAERDPSWPPAWRQSDRREDGLSRLSSLCMSIPSRQTMPRLNLFSSVSQVWQHYLVLLLWALTNSEDNRYITYIKYSQVHFISLDLPDLVWEKRETQIVPIHNYLHLI